MSVCVSPFCCCCCAGLVCNVARVVLMLFAVSLVLAPCQVRLGRPCVRCCCVAAGWPGRTTRSICFALHVAVGFSAKCVVTHHHRVVLTMIVVLLRYSRVKRKLYDSYSSSVVRWW